MTEFKENIFITLLKKAFNDPDKTESKSIKITGIPTGFKQLDEYLGGLHSEQLITIIGDGTISNSTLGSQIAINAALCGYQVKHFAIESPYERALRILTSESGIPYHSIKNAKVTADEFAELSSVVHRLMDLKIDFLRISDFNFNDPCIHGDDDLIIFDCLEALMVDQESLVKVLIKLKELAINKQVPVILITNDDNTSILRLSNTVIDLTYPPRITVRNETNYLDLLFKISFNYELLKWEQVE